MDSRTTLVTRSAGTNVDIEPSCAPSRATRATYQAPLCVSQGGRRHRAQLTTTSVEPDVETDWYGLSADDVCRRLDVDPAAGLSAAEVVERRQRYGPNKLAEEAKEPGWRAFLRQYRDLMQLVLVGAAVVSIVALQDVSTGLVVLGLTVRQRRDGSAPGGQGRRERRRAAPDADHDGERPP